MSEYKSEVAKAAGTHASGALQELVAEFDWSGTPLGPPDKWPSWIRNTVSLILQAQVPIVTFWGETGTMIYNDHFAEFAGGRHPASLGAPVREVWPEVADINSYVIQEVLAGRTVRLRDQELTLKRNGAAEKVWLNADYSPVLDDEGQPVGVLALLAERTEDILADRKVDAEQARLHQMFDQAPGFMAMLRSPGHIFDLTNAAYMQLIGHRDVIGKPVRQALPEIEGQGFYELLDKVYTSGEPYIGSALSVLLQRTPEATPEERFVDF
ncbi:PAS domain-containing protein, partial [Loktanella sp. DJP18]|uniref:PAS domain-containing protein n=1 Tax=Loktanella sp. DJP18 TaxID=3409788 RepID=UPI003BB71646